MDYEMTSNSSLLAAVRALRQAGYRDASKANPREGDPTHVLSVSTDDDRARDDEATGIVLAADPGARPAG